MGIETRIGIVAGLVIVVVASVYFFYGSTTEKDDLLVAPGSKIADATQNNKQPLKIPPGSDKKPSPGAVAGGKTPGKGVTGPNRPTTPAEKMLTYTGKPATAGAPPASPAVTPAAASGNRPAGTYGPPAPTPATERRPPVPNTPQVVKADDGSSTIGKPSLGAEGLTGGQSRSAASPLPGADSAGQPSKTTVLRTGPSQDLVDATRQNLENAEHRTTTSAPSGMAASERTRPGASDRADESKKDDPRRHSPSEPAARDASKPGEPAKSETAKTAASTPDWPKQHKVVAGDTISAIVQHYYGGSGRIEDVLAANSQIKDPRRLKIGEMMVLPAPKAAAEAEKNVANSPAVNAAEKPRTDQAAKTYPVKAGDTFYSIAKEVYGNGARWKEIYELNKETLKNDPKRLRPGMVLKLPE